MFFISTNGFCKHHDGIRQELKKKKKDIEDLILENESMSIPKLPRNFAPLKF